MNIQSAFSELQTKIPTAHQIAVEADVVWRRGRGCVTEYTVAVFANREHYQQSCVADLEGAVRTIIGEANGPKASDLAALDRELVAVAMDDINDGADGNVAQFSNDNG
jgi:hypothetical protein